MTAAGTGDEEKREQLPNLLSMLDHETAPAPVAAPESASPLTIHLFGPFEARRPGGPLPRLRSRKGQWLLALLVFRHGRAVERAWLAGTLWPDSTEAAAFASLRSCLKDLRHALGSEAGRLRSPTPRLLCLDLEGALVDVAAFDAAIARGDAASLEQAVALYRGPLLEGCAEEWAFQERQAREQAYLGALESLAAPLQGRGERAAAERHLRRAVALDPLRETAQRALMQLLAAAGNYAAALTTYRDLRLHLLHELNAAPDPETQALFQQLRAAARAKAGTVGMGGAPPVGPERSPAGPASQNLPLQLTRFIGREDQLAEIEQLLTDYRLVTLTGAGGCGKTRLALEVAAGLRERFPDGVWFVDLAPLTIPELVPQVVAMALGLQEAPGQPPAQRLQEYLQPRELLLLLDNCEHLIDAGAQLAQALLQRCPQVRVLATSREALGITGERAYRVPPLSLPDPQRLPGLEQLTQYEAVHLFMERAVAVLPAFQVTNENARAVTEVCRRLEGMPLAIELAAARMRALPVEQINERLDNMFRLLTGGSRTALPRQQTLRALIDWSYDLLSEPERLLLRRLSVFAGGWSLEAAEAVCSGAGIEAGEVLDLLTSLIEKSLVVYEGQDGEPRYRLLETVRRYSRDRLLEAGAVEPARERHRDFFLQAAERAETKLRGSEQLGWLQRLDREHDNMRQALEWGGSAAGSRAGLRLATALWRFWVMRNHFSEGRQWLEGALARTKGVSPPLRARALAAAAQLAGLGGDETAAERLHEEALHLARETGEQWLVAWVLVMQGIGAINRGDGERATLLGEEGLGNARAVGDRWLIAAPLVLLGMAARVQGDYAAAMQLHGESLALLREVGDRWWGAIALINLGATATARGDYEQAAAHARAGVALCREMADNRGIVWCIHTLAEAAAGQGRSERAVRLLGAAAALREASASSLPLPFRTAGERTLAAAQAALGKAAFAAAWTAGRATPLEQAIAWALTEEG